MDRKTQGIVLVVIVAFAAAVAVVAIPQLAHTPRQVEVIDEQGQTVLQSDYVTRYADIPYSRTEDGGFVLGHADAPVTIVEFADFYCPVCQEYHATVQQFIDQYVATGEAKFEYRLFPVVSVEFSEFSAKLAECAGQQQPGMFWAAHDLLFDLASRSRLNQAGLAQSFAETLSLDQNLLMQCTETAQQFQTDTALGQAAGVNGTPTVFVRLDDDTLGYPMFEGQLYNQGQLPLSILQQVVEAENIEDVVVVPQPIVANLIADEPCAAPCWRGITPGETTWDEAAEIVRANKDLLDMEEQAAADESGAKVMFWRSLDGIDCCNMLSENGTSVDELLLLSSSAMMIGDVIEVRGDPTYAITRETAQGGFVVSLFYPENSLIVYVFVAGQSARDFNEESQIVGVSYMSPERSEQVIEELAPSDWAGYSGFLQYNSSATAEPEPQQTVEPMVTDDMTPEVQP